jgi:DNA replicative helicase MCM subunit Mcm2 (Cdc46/Mcm family)
VAGNGDQIRMGDNNGDQIMKDDAYMKFMHFILEVQVKNTYIYREQLQNNANKGSYFLKVDMDDLNNFDEQLSLTLRSYPSEYIPVFEKAVQQVYKTHYFS